MLEEVGTWICSRHCYFSSLFLFSSWSDLESVKPKGLAFCPAGSTDLFQIHEPAREKECVCICVCVHVCVHMSVPVVFRQGSWTPGRLEGSWLGTEDDMCVLSPGRDLQLSLPVGRGPSYYAIFQELLDPAFCFSGCLLPRQGLGSGPRGQLQPCPSKAFRRRPSSPSGQPYSCPPPHNGPPPPSPTPASPHP